MLIFVIPQMDVLDRLGGRWNRCQRGEDWEGLDGRLQPAGFCHLKDALAKWFNSGLQCQRALLVWCLLWSHWKDLFEWHWQKGKREMLLVCHRHVQSLDFVVLRLKYFPRFLQSPAECPASPLLEWWWQPRVRDCSTAQGVPLSSVAPNLIIFYFFFNLFFLTRQWVMVWLSHEAAKSFSVKKPIFVLVFPDRFSLNFTGRADFMNLCLFWQLVVIFRGAALYRFCQRWREIALVVTNACTGFKSVQTSWVGL